MKKIGICTLYFANNFGAILQAFSLQEVLKKMGYDVQFIKIKDFEKQVGISNLEEFEKSKEYLNISKENYDNTRHKYDAIIIGSDEVWNLNNNSFEHLDEYFGIKLNADKLVTYAPSANGTTIEKLREVYEDKIDFSTIHELSARDKQTQKLIKDASGRDATIVLDPTLLMESFDKYAIYKEPEKKDYIVIYGYTFSKTEQEKIKAFAKKNNKTIYSLGFKQDWCETLKANIFEFLGYIQKADYVITNTFHGLLFSIILEKEFVIFSNNVSKINDMLEKFELKDRDAVEVQDLSDIFKNKINYEKINGIKLEKRKESLNFLKNAIN